MTQNYELIGVPFSVSLRLFQTIVFILTSLLLNRLRLTAQCLVIEIEWLFLVLFSFNDKNKNEKTGEVPTFVTSPTVSFCPKAKDKTTAFFKKFKVLLLRWIDSFRHRVQGEYSPKNKRRSTRELPPRKIGFEPIVFFFFFVWAKALMRRLVSEKERTSARANW